MEERETKRAKRDGEWRKEQEKEGEKDMRHAEKNEHCAGNLGGFWTIDKLQDVRKGSFHVTWQNGLLELRADLQIEN